jgi:multiple sugar transport system ATP-binding protein
MTLGDRIAVLKAGVLQQVDAPLAVYDRPVNKFVAGFLGSPSMNFVDAVVDGAGVKVGEARWAAEAALAAALASHAGAKVTAGVRPEHIVLSDAPGALKGQVEFSEVLGAERLLYVQTAAGRLVVRVAPDQSSAIGANVGLMPEPGGLRVFDAADQAVGVAAGTVVGT